MGVRCEERFSTRRPQGKRRGVSSKKEGEMGEQGAAGAAAGSAGSPQAGAAQAGDVAGQIEQLANALKLEQAKNEVLLGEVIALEDEIVNRCMQDFEGVVSEETKEFWREQLLSNREAATVALGELARVKQGAEGEPTPGPSKEGSLRRPLHNRAVARPLVRGATGEAAGGSEAQGQGDDRAARIRNRAHEIAKGERVPFSVAFRRAEREVGPR